MPTLIALFAWLVTAPSPRFGYFLFWILACTMVACLYRVHRRPCGGNLSAILFWGRIVLALANNKKFLVMPPPDGWLHPTPAVPAEPFVTESGLTVYIPADGGYQCWDMRLPCTPFPRRELRCRRPGRIRSGFLLDRSSDVLDVKMK